jgi:hypothetical protein
MHVYKFDNIFEYGYDILNIDSSRSLQVVLQSNWNPKYAEYIFKKFDILQYQ